MICKTCWPSMRCACPCHPILRGINGGTCPLCDVLPVPRFDRPIEVVSADWRAAQQLSHAEGGTG